MEPITWILVLSLAFNGWAAYELGEERETSENISQIVIDQSKLIDQCYEELDKNERNNAKTEASIRALAESNANQIAELERLDSISADFYECEIPIELVNALQPDNQD